MKGEVEDLRNLLRQLEGPSAAGEVPPKAAHAILEHAERLLNSGDAAPTGPQLWHEWLHRTGNTGFLRSLDGRESRYRWAEACFQAIQASGYTLRHMFEQRVSDMPDRTLFEDLSLAAPGRWSYRAVARQVREIASAFCSLAAPAEPRVAIFSENCVAGACCDLACLFYDLLDTPLNTHFNSAVLAGIFDRLQINLAVTDTEERRDLLLEVRSKAHAPFQILALHRESASEEAGIPYLGSLCKRMSEAEIARILEKRRRFAPNEVATVMFTSGSTGVPKGVSFSIYNLVSKRFARAAALPEVGRDEILLCYLPLYHTFGRYLEMLGMIYWGGTYVFTGNPSFETLLSLLPTVQPTGLISIPLRWAQLEEHCLAKLSATLADRGRHAEFRAVTGSRLRWGLSAAGYLDPRVFQFFNRNGVALCSGFGMTEATGGITMTPPFEYVDDTNGLPLPGIKTRLTETGELELSGHYLARYLEDKGPGEFIPYPGSEEGEHWLGTGDLFRVLPNGYFQIVDRIKDIYKNDKGQTIAPRIVEREFDDVPGIKRAFLVGDRKAYNVLLIVPDARDPVLQASGSPENQREYFRRIVSAANRGVAPYERVVNFALLDRDFDIDSGELTAKGTFNRRAIEQNFADRIIELYRSDAVEIDLGDFCVTIPRWFFRDLSILEDDIGGGDGGLHNRSSGGFLPIRRNPEAGTFFIGDLEYRNTAGAVDLGLFARQPRLWIGNPSLASFCPCKEGWDAPLGVVSPQVMRPWTVERKYSPEDLPRLPQIREQRLATANNLISVALFGDQEPALAAVQEIGELLSKADLRWNEVLRRRLEALSRHPVERIRCLAYQILLLDDPSPEYGKVFPAFLESGLTFLDDQSMEAIAGRFEKYRLEALRRRLLKYRLQLSWPADDVTRNQFGSVFQLLLNFVEAHPSFYGPVRAELAVWSLHQADPALAEMAKGFLRELQSRFEIRIASVASQSDPAGWRARLVYDDPLSPQERKQIDRLLTQTPFLKQAIMFAFQEEHFFLEAVAEKGIWISRIPSSRRYRRYRMSINLRTGRHYDLELVLGEDFRKRPVIELLYWTLALAGHPLGPRILPRAGCFSVNLRARSNLYLGGLTAWEKIREYSGFRGPRAPVLTLNTWRKLFVQALTAFYHGWSHSGSKIVPGEVTPNNVIVPELDFQAGGIIVSLTGWRAYKDPLSLIRPMAQNFYSRVVAHYPWCKDQLSLAWIFDACLEALGVQAGRCFLEELKRRLARGPSLDFDGTRLSDELENYLARTGIYLPLALYNAVDRFAEWSALNPEATPRAQEQTVDEVYWLYRLDEHPEYVRYHLYRQTYFKKAGAEVTACFDRLLARMSAEAGMPAMQLAELSDLQDALAGEEDRNVFSRLVFPRRQTDRRLEVIRVGESDSGQVIVSSRITDRYGEHYMFREAIEPREIGQLYRYFFGQNIPKTISEQDRYYILADVQGRVVGGICYQMLDNGVVQLEGIVVAPTLQGRGIRGSMEEEFCSRMASQGVEVIRAHFLLQQFYLSLGYTVDRRWGTLVKFLSPERA